MKLALFKKSLSTSIVDACKQCLTLLKGELADETIYAFSIYASSGFVTMGAAVATQESLSRRNKLSQANELQKLINTMSASEWQYVNCHHELFAAVNESIDEYFDCLFDGEFEDHDFADSVTSAELNQFSNDVFTEVLVKVLQELKSENCFVGSNFVSDVLLGLQFGDPPASAPDMMENVSAQVNSRMWHEKVAQSCSYLRTGLPSQA